MPKVCTLAAALLLLGCSDGDPPPAGPIELLAEPDPAELLECTTAPPPAGQARAKHVTCAEELSSGPIAHGRVGDLLIENARARFIIRAGEESATLLGAYAGGLVDAAPQGGTDLIKELLPAIDLSAGRPDAIVVTDAGGDGDATVRVLFTSAPVGLISAVVPGVSGTVRARGAVDYELRAGEDALRITVQLTTREGVAAAQGQPMLLATMGAAEHVQPFRELLMDSDGPGGDGMATFVAEGPDSAAAIRFVAPEGAVSHVLSINIVTGGPRVTLREAEVYRFEARVGVGRTAAEAWNAVVAEEPWPDLRLEPAPGDRVEVTDAAGAPVLRTRAEPGEVVHLPAGDYGVRAGFDAFFPGTRQEVALPDGGTTVAVPAAPRGRLLVDAVAGGDAAAPVRVTVEQGGEAVARVVVPGDGEISLPPGEYAVTVSRGMEHTVHREDVSLSEGGEVRVTAGLDRVVDTAGWVAGDFHLHTEMSTDSTQSTLALLRRIVAEGLEVVASLDHDFVHDYPSLLSQAGVADRLLAVPGVEASSTTFGHIGAYPLAPDPARAGAGAPPWFDVSPGQLFDALRARGDEALGGAIVQLNHPRFGGASFFDAVMFDRETGRATASPADLGLPGGVDLNDFDFDVMEVWNGISRDDQEVAFEDWLSLHALGRSFPMVANSDTHTPSSSPGVPRTYVAVTDDRPGAFAWPEVGDSLRAGRTTLSGGIFVTAEPAAPPSSGTLPLAVRVQAAPWVDVERLRIWAGRAVAVDRPVTADPALPVRVDEVIDVPLGGAAFVVVRADGTDRPRPVIRRAPFGVTNAIPIP